MDDLRQLLTREEKDLIDDYINCNANEGSERDTARKAEVDTILFPWSEAKSGFLGKPFAEAGSLILKENINYSKSLDIIMKDIDCDPDILKFIRDVDSYFSSKWSTLTENEQKVFDCVWELLRSNYLAQNEYYGTEYTLEHPDDPTRSIIVAKKCKPVKMIGKLNSIFHFTENYEAFRLAHSRILNTKKLRGELCISIHPMDYMTMSDNECGWDSCMSWINEGSYRLGTVEMMNSPFVVVAYLTSSTPMRFFSNEWNSKKWRCLFIITPELITSVKGYPYNSHELNTIVINKLRKLYNEVEYADPEEYEYMGKTEVSLQGKRLEFHSNHMYNDFGTTTHDGCIRTYDDGQDIIYVNYSGPAECMWCGDYMDDVDDGDLVCKHCGNMHVCYECGCSFGLSELVYIDSRDIYVCDDCFNLYYKLDYVTNEYYHRDELSGIAIIPSKYKDEFEHDKLHMSNNVEIRKKWEKIFRRLPQFYVYSVRSLSKTEKEHYFNNANLHLTSDYFYSSVDFYIYEDELIEDIIKDIEVYLKETGYYYLTSDYFSTFDEIYDVVTKTLRGDPIKVQLPPSGKEPSLIF